MRSRVVVVLCAIQWLLGAARAQEGVPASYTCRITIDDPLPWLKAALRSDSLRSAFRSGVLGDALRITGGYDDLEPTTLWRRIRAVSQVIPKQVTVSFPPATSGSVGGLVRMMAARDLLHATYWAEKLDEDALLPLRREFRGELQHAFAAIPAMAFAVSLQCRDERTAMDWYDAVAEILEVWRDKNEGMTLETGDDHAVLSFALGEHVARADLNAFFSEWVTDVEEVIDDVYKLVKGLELRFEVRISGDTLTCHCQPVGGEQAQAQQTLPIPPLDGGSIATFQFDLSAFVTHVEAAAKLWEKHGKTELGKIILADDDSGTLGDLAMIAREAKRVEAMSGAVHWTEHGIAYAVDMPPSDGVAIQGNNIWQLIPAEAASYTVDGTTTMSAVVYDAMVRIEDQMERSGLRAMVEEAENAEELNGQIIDYYARVAGLRRLLRERSEKVLQAPSLMMFATTPATGPRPDDAPQAGFAMASRLQRGADGLAYARRIVHEVVTVLQAEDKFDARAVNKDLGLGVATVSFPFRKLLPTPAGDFQLHAFVVDDHLVISTSLSVSRSILQQRELPRQPACGPQTVHKAAVNGARMGVWMMAVSEQLGRVLANPKNGMMAMAGDFRLAMAAVAGTVRLLGGCEFETITTPEGRRERGELRFLASPRDGSLEEILRKVRKALGPWPNRVSALKASGDSRYKAADGKFTFTCGSNGHYHNQIKAIAYEENVYTGKPAWSISEGGYARTVGNSERDLLIGYDAILSGQWTESPLGMQIQVAPDSLPGQAPELLLTFPDSKRVMRIWLEPDTWLPAAFSMDGRSIVYQSKMKLSGWRSVRGRMLPYRIAASSYGDDAYRIKSWKVATLHEGKPARPKPPGDTSFKGKPQVPFEPGMGGVVQVQAGGKKVWLRFGFQSGDTLISRRALREMGCSVADDDQWATIKRLRIGPMTIRDHTVGVIDPPAGEDDDDPAIVHGTIGIALAARSCIDFDYARSSLALYPPGSFKDHKADFVKVGYEGRVPTVPMHLDRRTVVACQLLFMPSADKITFYDSSQLTDYRVPRKHMRMADAGASARGFLMTQLSSAKLAGQRLEAVPVAWPMRRCPEYFRSGPVLFLSMRLLDEDFRLLVDLPGERAAFVPR